MKHLNTSKQMSRVFRGMVLALALILVACGGDSDDPAPTATSGVDQAALPTVPSLDSTPDADVSEDEITVLQPEIPATDDASTPDSGDTDEVTDLAQTGTPDGLDTASPPVDDEGAPSPQPTSAIIGVASTPLESSASPPTDDDLDLDDGQSTPEVVESAASTPEGDDLEADPTERVRTGDETFDHPGDGTGGSGMPGEMDGDDAVEDPSATPQASPIAQLSISGCEVPDVPAFLGDDASFVLTADVNFRSGPGVDCDPLLDEPLGEGQTVEVIGGPVTQTVDDSEWVQIEIDGEPGWITTEFIEPTE